MTSPACRPALGDAPAAEPAARSWPERFRPWQGPATRSDVALIGAFAAVVALGLVFRPLTPLLIASHPVALELVSGDVLSVGVAAAFARLGEVPLWLVVLAGTVGMAKFDWLAWWAGRRWGEGMIRMIASPQQAARWAARAATLNPWVVRAAVVAAVLPGIPTPIVHAVAGMTKMRLATFVALDLAGTLLMTGAVAALGYGLGQYAVDVVLVVERYAARASLAILLVTFLVPWLRARWRRFRERAHERRAPSARPGD